MLHTARAFDVVVIGGGHAGCEAAAAACRVGARTLLVTQRLDTVGVMSCNPSIGGVGKGTLVREVDAMGGLMGRVADAAGIQFRMLNRSKGEAVWGPRCQADRVLYQREMNRIITEELPSTGGLQLLEASVDDLQVEEQVTGPCVTGIRLADGSLVKTASVVITTGTFLRGRLLLGDSTSEGGRMGERPSGGIARTFERLNVQLGRMKTGTPPRLDGRTIDWGSLEEQVGDSPPQPFSFVNRNIRFPERQLSCHMAFTNEETHRIVRDNRHLAPKHTGAEPRYCPSIDSKVVRFADKESHQIWLEPEGYPEHTHIVYPNGISTALPIAVQREMIQSIAGLERCEIVQPGYAVEYDYVLPSQLDHSLAVRCAKGLFLAGQINGTTGYEEAAAQGLLAGANAALFVCGKPALVLGRDEALSGVLVDDLVTKGVTEPYRMFTSRAENRLLLRADNADIRLSHLALAAGALSEGRDAERLATLRVRAKALGDVELALKAVVHSPDQWSKLCGLHVSKNGVPRSGWDLLGSGGAEAPALLTSMRESGLAIPDLESELEKQLLVTARYDPYIRRSQAQLTELELSGYKLPLPSGIDYDSLTELSGEERERLRRERPGTVGAAAALEGITATGMSVLLRQARRSAAAGAGATREMTR
mmetsp:Transcript_23932/g.60530  ORF Transcript_23932/g.60530 Transcript_23932/m.60530 type:complete len:650 (-) Transcript_23932:55-2004(-)